MASRTEKVIVSFNRGCVSPLLDARSDLAPMASACRELKNMLADPEGGARRRPGLRFIGSAKGTDIGGPGWGQTSGAFIEMPLYHMYQTLENDWSIHLIFRGVMRLFESGTVALIGQAIIVSNYAETNPDSAPVTPQDYKVWIGPDATTGELVSVGAAGLAVWSDITWSIRPAAGSFVHLLFNFGGAPGIHPAQDHVRVAAWPDGWRYPITLRFGAVNPAFQVVTIERVGDELTLAGEYQAGEFDALHGISYGALLSRVAPVVDPPEYPGDWTIHFAQYASIADFSYAVAIPDDAATGMVVWGNLNRIGATVYYGPGWLGPFQRAAPVVQTGFDPAAPAV
jgi:hypothetical protein